MTCDGRGTRHASLIGLFFYKNKIQKGVGHSLFTRISNLEMKKKNHSIFKYNNNVLYFWFYYFVMYNVHLSLYVLMYFLGNNASSCVFFHILKSYFGNIFPCYYVCNVLYLINLCWPLTSSISKSATFCSPFFPLDKC